MRTRFFVFLSVCMWCATATATENLIENISWNGSCYIQDNIIYQNIIDTAPYLQWKIQERYPNDVWIQPTQIYNNQLGYISMKFVTSKNLDNLLWFRFGLNGIRQDTAFTFQIKDVQPNTEYTIQWNLLNNEQGSVAWTDMLVIHCPDGYNLELGDTECSRTCPNIEVFGGHIKPDVATVYSPAECTYNDNHIECDTGYYEHYGACIQLCTGGTTKICTAHGCHNLYTERPSTPALCIQNNNTVCYGRLVAGHATGTQTMHVKLDGTVYHLEN